MGDQALFPSRDREVSFAIASVPDLMAVQGTGGLLPRGKETQCEAEYHSLSSAVRELCNTEIMNVRSFTYVPIHVIMV
jgi:hypothetical protein